MKALIGMLPPLADDWQAALSTVAPGQVRQGDQLEVLFMIVGSDQPLVEWLEVDTVSPELLRVAGVPIQRGTEALPAAVAVADHLASRTGWETRVADARWGRP